MKKNFKILLFIFLAFIFINQVNAAGEFKVGNNYYDNLKTAIAAISNEGTITLQSDCNSDLCENMYRVEIPKNVKITIDLNNYTIEKSIAFENLGDLTIKNGKILTSYISGNTFNNNENSVLNIENVEIKNDVAGYSIFKNKGKLTLNNVIATNKSHILINRESGVATLDNVKFLSEFDMLDNYGKLIINSGNFTVVAINSLNFLYGETIINGGTFTTTTNDYFLTLHRSGIINLLGGKFIAKNSKGILNNSVSSEQIINIGKNDGEIKDIPYIYIPSGDLNFEYTDYLKLNYFDGIIILKEKIKFINELPEGYQICYMPYEGVLKATLGTSCNAHISNNVDNNYISNDFNNNSNNSISTEIENPQTGLLINIVPIIVIMLIGIVSLIISKRNRKIHKL